MSRNKFCIAFAGSVGSSKTPIAQYLSYTFNLPIFSNDTIRTEVIEDLGEVDKEEYEKRKNERGGELLKSGHSFIYDASIDREWVKLNERLIKYNYSCFIVSLNLSKDFLVTLYNTKGYVESLERIDSLISDHHDFIVKHGDVVDVSIDDQSFPDRLKLVANSLSMWLEMGD